jgi:hypothetical protein
MTYTRALFVDVTIELTATWYLCTNFTGNVLVCLYSFYLLLCCDSSDSCELCERRRSVISEHNEKETQKHVRI